MVLARCRCLTILKIYKQKGITMKKTIMICDCCGEEFFSEYYRMGYIDHVVNFAQHFDSYIVNAYDEERIFREICFHGNSLRKPRDVYLRANCFKSYCSKTNRMELFNRVMVLVNAHRSRIKQLYKIHNDIYDVLKDVDDDEKEFIGIDQYSFRCKYQYDEEDF